LNKPHLHTCSLPTCGTIIPDHCLMCRVHWRLVPYANRVEVRKAWEKYQSRELSITDLREVQARATAAVMACGRNATSESRRSKGGA